MIKFIRFHIYLFFQNRKDGQFKIRFRSERFNCFREFVLLRRASVSIMDNDCALCSFAAESVNRLNANLFGHYATHHPPANHHHLPVTPIIGQSVDNPNFNERSSTTTVNRPKSFREMSLSIKLKAMKAIKLNRCTVCQLNFESAAEIIGHFQTEHTTEVFVCNEVDCGNAYMTKTGLASHRESKHRADDVS